MRRAVLLPTFLLSSAPAASVPAVSVIRGLGATVNVPPSLGVTGMEYLVQFRMAASASLNLNVFLDTDARTGERVSAFVLGTYSRGFSQAELGKVSALVGALSTRCLNISRDRLPAVGAWLAGQNRKTRVKASGTLGPLRVEFGRYLDPGPQAVITTVTLSRSGQPGAAPWTNFCTDSGRG